jgi:XTP/dITP diphosphohydrolase
MEVLFATNNQHKAEEIQSLLPADIHLITLKEAGIVEDIPEPFETLEDNARAKIRYILDRCSVSAGFSEDSGLFISALQGRPGVHSAHYAGPHRSDKDNIQKVLTEMKTTPDRDAFFQTTICLIWDNKEYMFTGICPGQITSKPSGDQGFGYDPIFIPQGKAITFAEMNLSEKNQVSHRKKAVLQLIDFLYQAKKSG